jgi:N-acetylmuramoyl-L-alanine amidase
LVVVLSVGLAVATAALLRERMTGPLTGTEQAQDVQRTSPGGGAPATSPPGLPPSAAPASADEHAPGLPEGSTTAQSITASALGLTPGEEGDAATPLDAPASEAAQRLYSAPRRIDPAILPLSVRRVVVDPGHGGHNPGTVASDLLEKELTLDIALRLEKLLSAGGWEVAMTRDDDTHVELADRVDFANQQRGDLFVSIHVNWLGTTDARGIETFYLGPTDDPILEQLAHVENKSSGYSLTDFRTLLDGIYADARRDVSRDLAASIHGELVRHLRKVSPKLRDRGVRTAPFVVLIGTEMPAVLAEVSCLSSTEEIALLRESSYRQQIAEALHAGIASYARSLEPGPVLGRPPTTIAAGGQGH